MKRRPGIAALIVAAAVLLLSREASAQTPVPIRRALPVQEPPVARAIPVETPPPAAAPTIMRALPVPDGTDAIPAPTAPPSAASGPPVESAESPEQHQLNYANALFGRKLYDLAVPEYEKFLGLYPNSSESRHRAFLHGAGLSRPQSHSRRAHQFSNRVATIFPTSELAGPASYGLAEISFNEKDFASALPLFHRAAAKVKASALALSARYFEARCLENLDRKDEARDRLSAGHSGQKSESFP